MHIKNIKANILNDVEFMKILKCSHYNPTQEKLDRMVKLYSENEGFYTFGAFDRDQILGFIVIKNVNKQHKIYEIVDIAVDEFYRKLGIGSQLIDYVIENFDMVSLHAETDEEAVEFYKKYGFNIKMGSKIGNINRYKCEYRL